MTPSQILKQSLEEFDKKFLFSRIHPKIMEDVKNFLKSHTLSLIRAESERLEKIKKGDRPKNYIEAVGYSITDEEIYYNQAIQDQINFLVQQEKEIEEL